jgi:hypothetical protein
MKGKKGKEGMKGMDMKGKPGMDGMKGKQGMEGMDHGAPPKTDPAPAKAVCDQIKNADPNDPLIQALALKCHKQAQAGKPASRRNPRLLRGAWTHPK